MAFLFIFMILSKYYRINFLLTIIMLLYRGKTTYELFANGCKRSKAAAS
jgi:hypothetical protein